MAQLIFFGFISQAVELWALSEFAHAVSKSAEISQWLFVLGLFALKSIWSVAYSLILSHWDIDLRYSLKDKLLRTSGVMDYSHAKNWVATRLGYMGRQIPESIINMINGMFQVCLGSLFVCGLLIILYRTNVFATGLASGLVLALCAVLLGVHILIRPWMDRVWSSDLREDQRWTDELGIWQERQYLGLNRFQNMYGDYPAHRRARLRRDVLRFVQSPVLELGFLFAIVLTLLWVRSQGRSDYAELITLIVFVQRLQSRALSVMQGFQQMRDEFPLWRQLANDLTTFVGNQGSALNDRFRPANNGLLIEKMAFSYGDRKLFSDFSLKLEPGRWMYLHGKNGSGKSTLCQLIAGLLIPNYGAIYCGRVQIVGASPFIITGDLWENLILGRPLKKGRVEQTLSDFGLWEYLTESGLDWSCANLRERNLSRGEVQIIGLARAVLDFQDVLILDEATSALSLDFERRFLGSLKMRRPGTSVIVVSHRASVEDLVDTVLNLNQYQVDRCDYPLAQQL